MEIKRIRYALSLDETNRVTSYTFDKYADGEAIIVDTLPDGNVTDYKYIKGEYVYDPLPKPEPQPTEPTVEEDTLSMLVDHEERIINLELGLTE